MEDRSVKTIAFTLMWCEECTDPYLITTEWKEKKKKIPLLQPNQVSGYILSF